MAYISRAVRQLVTERASGLCEYCHTAQAIVIEMEIDHSVPEVVGGITEAGNLCLACIPCNTCKRDYQTGIDSQIFGSRYRMPGYRDRGQALRTMQTGGEYCLRRMEPPQAHLLQ